MRVLISTDGEVSQSAIESCRHFCESRVREIQPLEKTEEREQLGHELWNQFVDSHPGIGPQAFYLWISVER